MLRVTCHICGRTTSADDKHAGRRAKCPKCREMLTLPQPPLSEQSINFQTPPKEASATPVATPLSSSQSAFNIGFGAALGCLTAVGVVTIGGCVMMTLFAGVASRNASRPGGMMDQIHQQVAQDAIRQYEIAARSGNATDVYVRAGLVAEAFLQAKDEANYQKWREIRRHAARRAGMPASME